MDAPTIFDLLDRLAFLRGMPSVIILLSAAFISVVVPDMRIAVSALLTHYLFAGLLFVDVLEPRLAVTYTLVGLFVSAILFVTGLQVNWGRLPPGLTPAEASRLCLAPQRSFGHLAVSRRALLRLILTAGILVAVWMLLGRGERFQSVIPVDLAYLIPAIAGLAGMGLVGLASSAEPLPAGIGLLLFLTGFALYCGFLDQSLAMTVALTGSQLIVAMAVAYLAQARYLPVDILD